MAGRATECGLNSAPAHWALGNPGGLTVFRYLSREVLVTLQRSECRAAGDHIERGISIGRMAQAAQGVDPGVLLPFLIMGTV